MDLHLKGAGLLKTFLKSQPFGTGLPAACSNTGGACWAVGGGSVRTRWQQLKCDGGAQVEARLVSSEDLF